MKINYTPGPLLDASRTTPTALWNDSADLDELRQSIAFGGVGATCNPVIGYTTIKKHPDIWEDRIRAIAENNPTWESPKSDGRPSRTCQSKPQSSSSRSSSSTRAETVVSPSRPIRAASRRQALADQAEEFSNLAPNIIVKIPCTSVGIEAIEEATYRGVSVNVTVSFTVPQAVKSAEAIERGLQRRAAEGKPIDEMGPVVTIMAGRLDDWLKIVAERDRLFIDPGHLEWAGIAAIKRANQIFVERGFHSRVLCAAFRNVLQWSELIGGDLVVSPPFKWQKRINDSDYHVVPRIDEPVAAEHLDALKKIPEFMRAYDPDGMTIKEFDTFGATRRTLRQFLQADADLDTLVRDIITPAI
ncbi:transaldolase [Cutibacterium acnes JCM 18918]|nr:transaldolase [Cutibacterium acnes JCM 18918]